MKFIVKKATSKVNFYDNTSVECNSLEDLLKIVYEENDKRTTRSIEVEGIDGKGGVCRLWFDFNSLQVQEKKLDGEYVYKARKQNFLGQTLVDSGIITQEQLDKALEEQRKLKFKEKIGEVLLRLGYCNAEQILYGLAKQIGVFLQVEKVEPKKTK